MKQHFLLLFILVLLTSCGDGEDGMWTGEWEGTLSTVSASGNVVESTITCEISTVSEAEYNLQLSVGGSSYDFNAVEDGLTLNFADREVGSDSIVRTFITGLASLEQDTILNFDYDVYSTRNGSFLTSETFVFSMTRE